MGEFREIFIFVSGSTPQIITETIYALATKKPPIYPDEIIVITTFEGAKTARESLEKKGILKALCKDYKIPILDINYEIPKDKKGLQLQDIRTTEDNESMANLINKIIQEKTRDEKNRLHCSIAGGRKTMSFYLGSALQLYGRKWDKLYHVLVTPEFESNREFFYKPLKNQKIKTPDGREINTDDAEITLAELPFIRLGEKTKIAGKSYDESVKAGQDAIDSAVIPQDVSVDFSERTLLIGNTKIKMQPVQLALYATILKLKKDCKKTKCEGCEKCSIKRTFWDNRIMT
ncbi:MAG: CRISPR-associated ring nuclease Csm6, partial [Proteobacteria bacterium]|nr:CRISPR-associated ring nuclease Csm6 [Pseudomonadota bacterium]